MHDQRIKDGVVYGVEHIMLHPKFTNYSVYDDYDIALVTVQGRIKFTRNIRPICLTTPHNNYIGMKLTVAGWGRLSDDINAAMGAVLQETRVRVKGPEECTIEVAKLVRYNDKSMICAHEKLTDACNVSY